MWATNKFNGRVKRRWDRIRIIHGRFEVDAGWSLRGIRSFGQIVQTAWTTNGVDGGVQFVAVQKMGLQDAGRSQQSAVGGWVPKGAGVRLWWKNSEASGVRKVGVSESRSEEVGGAGRSIWHVPGKLFVLNRGHDVVDGVGRLNVEGDGLAGQSLDGDLHDSTEVEHQVQGRLLEDVVVREGATVVKLLTSEDETLQIRRNALLVKNRGRDVVVMVKTVERSGQGMEASGVRKVGVGESRSTQVRGVGRSMEASGVRKVGTHEFVIGGIVGLASGVRKVGTHEWVKGGIVVSKTVLGEASGVHLA